MLDHPAPANKQVKGLLKGLRYISQIFETEKEQEMVIGLPTDVKHVAHIGWDGPTSLNSPSWMNEFHSAPLSTTFDPNGKQTGSPKSASQEIPLGGLPPPSPSRDEDPSSKPRRTRRHVSSDSLGSPSREPREHSSRGSRHSPKNLSTGSDSPTGEGSESSSSRRGRRHHKSDNAIGSGSGSESPARDLPSIPKQSRKKDKDKDKEGKKEKDKEGKKDKDKDKEGKKEKDKEGKKERRSKGSSDGGSTRSRSKNPPSSSGLPGSVETIARPATVEEEAV